MKPLSQRHRSRSLVMLLVIFVFATPFLLAYSSGYRFNFEDFTFEKTGGVFIHSNLSDVKVFINGEFVEAGGVFLKNVLVQNLVSNEVYSIRVEKDGYLSWYKDLIAYPNLVTEARIMMMPIEIPFKKITQFVLVEELDPKTKATSTKVTTEEYKDSLEFFTSTSTENTNLVVFEKEIIKATSTTAKATSTVRVVVPDYLKDLKIDGIENKKQLKESDKMIAWLEGGDVHMVWSGEYQSTPFFMCDPRGCRDKVIISLDTNIEKFDFYPNRNDSFVVSTQNHIFAVEADDRSKQNVQTIFVGTKPEFKLDGRTIFVKDGQDIYEAEI